jgi:hypothetical protein
MSTSSLHALAKSLQLGACNGLAARPWARAFTSVAQQTSTDLTVTDKVSLEVPLSTGRPKLCILGTGWAAARLARDIDPKQFDLVVRTRGSSFCSLICSWTAGVNNLLLTFMVMMYVYMCIQVRSRCDTMPAHTIRVTSTCARHKVHHCTP